MATQVEKHRQFKTRCIDGVFLCRPPSVRSNGRTKQTRPVECHLWADVFDRNTKIQTLHANQSLILNTDIKRHT